MKLASLIVGTSVVLLLAAILQHQLASEDSAISRLSVAQRAEASGVQFIAGLGPNTTFHFRQESFDATNHLVTSGAFVLPDTYISETWLYFAADGQLAEFVSTVRHGQTNELLQRTDLIDGDLHFFDHSSGARRVITGYSGSATELNSLISDAASQAEEASSLTEPHASASGASVDGRQTFVLEFERTGALKRTYVDQETFRTLKWERLVDGQVTASRSTPVFEVLQGHQVPSVPGRNIPDE